MSKLQCLSLPHKGSLGTYQLRVTVIDNLSWSPGRVQEVNDGRAAAPAEALLAGCLVNEDVLRVLQQPSDKRAAPPTPWRPAGTVALSLGLAAAQSAARRPLIQSTDCSSGPRTCFWFHVFILLNPGINNSVSIQNRLISNELKTRKDRHLATFQAPSSITLNLIVQSRLRLLTIFIHNRHTFWRHLNVTVTTHWQGKPCYHKHYVINEQLNDSSQKTIKSKTLVHTLRT